MNNPKWRFEKSKTESDLRVWLEAAFGCAVLGLLFVAGIFLFAIL